MRAWFEIYRRPDLPYRPMMLHIKLDTGCEISTTIATDADGTMGVEELAETLEGLVGEIWRAGGKSECLP